MKEEYETRKGTRLEMKVQEVKQSLETAFIFLRQMVPGLFSVCCVLLGLFVLAVVAAQIGRAHV